MAAKNNKKNNPLPRYFKCLFFKGQILNFRILEANDDVDIKAVFAKRYPSRNLLEAKEVIK